MQILIVTSRFPYPSRTGDTLTVFHLLKHFSQRHSIDLVSCTNQEPHAEHLDVILRYCRSVRTVQISNLRKLINGMRALLARKPLQAEWFYSPKVARTVDDLVKSHQYDVMYAHTIRVARYLAALGSCRPALRVLAMQISMQLNYRRLAQYESNFVYRMIFNHEAKRLSTYESDIVTRFDRALVISEVDRRAISSSNDQRIMECPHGVSVDVSPVGVEGRLPGSIVFSGNMNYRPNVDAANYFVRDIFPSIRARLRGATFYIVGANPSRSVRELSSAKGVVVTGEVESIYDWLRRACVGVNPLRAGAGLQNKVLEGMACGLPMVVTPVANEGIKAVEGTHLVVASSAAGFADHVVRLLESLEERRRLGQAARHFIESNWSWGVHFDRLEGLLEQGIAAGAGAVHGG